MRGGPGLSIAAWRKPGLQIAYIENGADWVGPFVEDRVEELAAHLPVERILFGSDWPHAEGMAENARELTFGRVQ
jgi:predicted TIM-barrel fold metal-dependent hydrolase